MHHSYSSAVVYLGSTFVDYNHDNDGRLPPQHYPLNAAQTTARWTTDLQQLLSCDITTVEFGYDVLSSNPSQQIPPQQPTDQRPASISRQATTSNSGVPPITNQYTLNGAIGTSYAYGTPAEWMTDPQQIQSPQTNIPPQMSAAYNVMFDPSQQPTYTHPNQYETSTYFSQQSQPQ
jgi:hypothetical protein